jgi:hypothetical protein
MDICYVFSGCQYFAGPPITEASIEVLRAKPRIATVDPKIDERMEADFVIRHQQRPPVQCGVWADQAVPPILGFIPNFGVMMPKLSIELEKARIEFEGFVVPSFSHAIKVVEKDNNGKLKGKKHTETAYVDGPQWQRRGEVWWTTYQYQLEAFVDMVKAKESGTEYKGPWVSLGESEKLMEIIDAVYEKAGLPLRGQ